MNRLQAVLLSSFTFVTSGASALTIESVQYPSAAPGYVKVVVQPQTSPMAADILFVIDNSGSMDPYQQGLAKNIPTLTNLISKLTAVVNVGVITTDMANSAESGRFLGSPAVLTSDMPGFESTLAARLRPGVNGDGMAERPLAAIQAALSEPLISSANSGFLRSQVPLNIILVSDEDDQSTEVVANYVSFLRGLKANAGVSLFSVVPTHNAGGCALPATKRTEEFTRAMNGEIFDLCSDDWSSKLRSIGTSIGVQIMRTVRLPTEPVVRTIEVKYGSKTLVAGDSYGGWIYDRNQMSIVIGEGVDFSSEPQGTELEIKFIPKYWQN